MLAKVNQEFDAIPTDRNVREFIAVCATHGISYGGLDDLAGFMRALHDNKHLAMNFWSVVARISESPANRAAGSDWLKTAIVEAVTGHTVDEVAAAGPAHRVLLGRLASMLAGEDIQLADELPLAPRAAMTFAKPPNRRDVFDDDAVNAIVPIPSRYEAATGSARPSPDASDLRATPEAKLANQRLRLVLQSPPDESPADPPPTVLRDERLPLSSYTQEAPAQARPGMKTALTAAAILVVALFGWFVMHGAGQDWQRFRRATDVGVASAVATWRADGASPGVAVQAKPAAQRPDLAPGATPAPPQQPLRATNRIARTPDTSEEASAETPAIKPDEAAGTDAEGRTVVPAAVMSQYLVSSRVPVYPDAARADHIQGRVLLQAVINENGFVGHLHVLDGDPALRRAALDAVSTWHYRPYLVDGTPVAVTTTIPVDFSGLN
jgi:TonB family protein